MARTHQTYPREIRQQLVEMVRAGRTPAAFEASAAEAAA